MNTLRNTALQILDHLQTYLSPLTDADYSRPLPLLSGSSIGMHTRHILDGYLCMMRQESSGKINYEDRLREAAVEQQTNMALQRLEDIRAYLSKNMPPQQLKLTVRYHGTPVHLNTDREREIVHNIEHTIHHLAIIKIALLAYFPEVGIPEAFGVAPSTLRYRKKICCQTGTGAT